MLDKMKQMMEMKKQADKLKKELEQTLVEVDDIKGIHITINGAQKFESITIDEELVGDKARLEKDVLTSINMAVKKSQNVAARKMQSMAGFNLPGL